MAKLCAGALVMGLMMAAGGAVAQEGLSGLHDWVRVGGKTCMVDHFHDGSGSGATKAQAMASAIRSWSDFTSWEYSARWGRYSAALSKSANCSGTRGNYFCSVSARPCRV
jgi:hypothetical protein